MIPILLYALLVFGIVYTIGHAEISRPIRLAIAGRFVDRDGMPTVFWRRWTITLIECPFCLAFWIGVALRQVNNFVPFEVYDGHGVIATIGTGLVTASLSFIIARVTKL